METLYAQEEKVHESDHDGPVKSRSTQIAKSSSNSAKKDPRNSKEATTAAGFK
jgi:hypothetical protein